MISVLIAGLSPVSGQSSFRVIGTIPHLPLIDPTTVTTPETGMLIFSSTDLKPMIYTGTAWETLCTGNINAVTAQEYFVVKNGIPFLPTFATVPVGATLVSGTIYYSTVDKSVMVYNGSGWTKMVDMVTGTIADNAGFTAGIGVKTFKLPVLNSNPSSTGLVAGAFYINSTSKVIRYYDGTVWQDISCQAVVKTLPVTGLTGYTAMSGGDVITNGGSPITFTGICWSPNSDPDTLLTTKTKLISSGSGVGVFTSQITGLLPKTMYHVRAYAVNSLGLVYGDDIAFTTPIAPPTIITLDATNIKSISAETGGDITADGGSPVTKRGIVWSSLTDPLNDPSYIITNDGSGVGWFPSTMDWLLGNTTYYVRAYAVNAAGTAYGNLVVFTTPPPVPPVLNPTFTINNITGSSAVGTALIMNNGGAIVTERGFCYSTDQVNYTYIPSTTVTPTDIGTFVASLTGLSQGTTYYVKGYAKNSVGTGYTSEASFVTAAFVAITTIKPDNAAGTTATSGGVITNAGFSDITARGICWDTTKNPTVDLLTRTSEAVTGDGTGTYNSILTGLLPGVTYYVRAYAINSAGTAYGNLDSLAMPDYPKVATIAASSLYISTATCGGNVLSDGGSPVTGRGVCWSTSANPTISNSHTSDGTGLGLFTTYLTGLTANVVYHFRAYAVNSIGVAYGDDLNFTVIPEAPLIITLPATDITSMSGVSGGDIQSSGGAPITLRGIMWSTKGDPLTDILANVITNDGSGVGIFPTKMDNLLGSTTYYVRAYAVNSYGKAYGDLKLFTTLPPILASVQPPTFDIENITNTTATGVFLVINNGGDPITSRGVRYSTDRINYTYVPSGTLNTTDIGTFVSNLTGLTPNTTYYAQTYAINAVGMALSSEASFRTTSLAALTTTPPNTITGFTAYSGGDITSTGDDIISAKGVCWSTTKNPTNDLLTKTSEAVSGIGTGSFSSYITGLTPGVKYYVRAYAVNSFGVAYGNLDSLTTATTAFVTTTTPTNITTTTATAGGYINNDGHDAVFTRGVCWSSHPNPTTADSYLSSGSGIGSFAVALTGLMGSTKYYVRAYAINSVGTAYGNQDSLKTSSPVLESVTTTDVINIGGTTALARGSVGNTGGAQVTERGFCWNTTGSPTTADAIVISGSGSGSYSGGLTGLTPNTKYYIRAYATNSVGTSYGNEISFSTFTTATIITTPAYEITSTTAKSGGDIISDGGALVYSSGICWNTTGNPTVSDASTNSGLGIGNFIHSMTGLMGSTTYYIRAYAINNAGTAYGQVEVFTTLPPVIPTLTTTSGVSGADGATAYCGGAISSNGGALINTQGIVFSTVSGFLPDTVTVNKTILSGSGNFTSTLSSLKPGTTYYARAYATNTAGTAYASNEVSFTTFDLPVITTVVPSAITNVTVNTGGNISSNGGTNVIESGLCWSTGNLPSIADEHLSDGSAFGLFTRTLTELFGSTTYYVRAYARNSVGLVYGQVESFTTQPPVLATIQTLQPVATSSVAAISGGNILSHGGSLVTSRGIYWSTQRNFDPDTIVYNKTAQTGYYKGTFNAGLSGLTPNTVYYVKAYVVNAVGVAYGDEMSFITPTLPTLTTAYASANGPTKAVSGGDISSDGGAAIGSRGVMWSTVASFNPDTIVVNKTSNGGGSGSFVSNLSGLKGNTTYYILAYATNIAGTSYGNLLSFITDPATLANLTTLDAWSINGTTAVSGGSVSDNGGEPITSRGVVWSTSPNFRPDTVVVNKTLQGAMGIGNFSTTMTGLARGTTYYVRAYAVNSIGIAYGNQISFKTLDFATLTTMPVSPSSTGHEASGGGTIISDGGAPVTNQGVCWSIYPGPTVGLYTKTTYDSGSGNNFYSNLTNLAPVTKYYVRAYANNSQGTAYGNEVTFTTPPALATITTTYATPTSKSTVVTGGNITFDGGAPVTQRGVIWSTDASFNPDTVVVNKSSDGVGSGKFNSLISNMQLSISYYIRAYAVTSAGISYGNQITITLFPTAPILNTTGISQVAGTSALSGGDITSDGGAPVTLKGICWSTSTNPITSDSHTTNGSGTDSFTAMLSGLLPNTLYYVRAYAINKIGTAYGIERTFQTNAIPTLTATTPVTNIIATTATSGGQITDDGRSPILSRGICWSTYSNPTIALATKTVDTSSSTIGSFIANMKNLNPSTTYYVRAYATNAVGTGYGSQVQFTTLAVTLPTLSTIHPFNVDSVRATSGGDIFDDGGMPITAKGICWSTTPNPTTALVTKLTYPTGGDSTYTSIFIGLSPGTKYYVRAFAINSKGTGYGNLDSLTTQAVKATVSNVVISNMTKTTANGSASVIADGGAPVTTRGICWNTTGIPTIADDTLQVGTGIGAFADTLKNLVEGPIYYVRAFAINSAGVAYSPVVSSFRICPSSFTVLHIQGLNGAPVTKTVTYGSVSSNASGAARCWITQNLGADHQAASATDATEPSSGWYWQFGRIQGYQYTTSRNPMTTWTSVSDTTNWTPANDPCNRLLGGGWRIPTATEYTNVIANGAIPFTSPLKLHYSGYLNNADGSILGRGTYGIFWGSTATSTTTANYLQFSNGANTMYSGTKWYGFTLRCLRDSMVVSKPSASNVAISNMTATSVDVSAAVTPDGGSPVTARGFCWNTTGNPSISDNVIAMGDSVGSFNSTLSGLKEGPTYYISAYATNSKGTAYSPVVTTFKICPPTFNVQHVAGMNGAPVSKTVTYHSVSAMYSGAARCWITQNLGADQQATSATDATEPSAGWYWQFNRPQGYQYAASRVPATTWTSLTETSDWVSGNDPCNLMLGGGWRIPTSTEYTNVIAGMAANGEVPFTSTLKLHNSGYLNYADGSLAGRGTYGIFWSSSATTTTYGTYLQFSAGANATYNSYKWHGFTLRCLRDTIVISKPSVSNVTFSAMTRSSVDASGIVTPDGGSPVTVRGFCWNTTGNPTTSDNFITTGNGVGNFTGTIPGLVEGPTYYVRAYATNSIGTAYSMTDNSFRVCPPIFTVLHIAGIDGAPVTKQVTYHAVSSTLSGKAVCWLTQNLGADSIATAVTDATDKSAGWYWQFNRIQGFKNDGTTRTPGISWIMLNETSNWTAQNDPCSHLLGSGWRIPTSTEWTNVDGAPQNWTTYNDAFASVLKLHNAGYLVNTTGALAGRGTQGNYWGSTNAAATTAYDLQFTSTTNAVITNDKAFGFSVRCLRDSATVYKPSIGAVAINTSTMTATTADLSSAVASDGGATVTARGFCWNNTGNPTLADNVIADATGGTGNFAGTMTGLSEGPKFYVRAYATNSAGTSYSEGTGFSALFSTLCPDTFNIQHNLGFRGAPVTKTVTYHATGSYLSGAAKCWITQNLGADHPATSATDNTEASAGWYFQFNHSLGYKNNGATTPVAWITGFNEAADWTAINDPCNLMLGADWRIPTYTEWQNATGAPQNWASYTDAYNTELKLHTAGYLAYNTGGLAGRGTQGNYWSSTRSTNTTAWDLQFYNVASATIAHDKAYGFSVRCLRSGVVKMPPTLSNVTLSSTAMTDSTAEGVATVLLDGGATVTQQGLCWNTTGNPTINDNKVVNGTTNTTFTTVLTGLKEGVTYYVRAYAVNKIGISYSPVATSFKICKPVKAIHIAGLNGAPVSKNVTYPAVSANLTGKLMCWLAQNLGSDQQATSVTDATEPSAGWYWQFNRSQGYKYSTVRTPNDAWTAWITSISENSDWQAVNDPCNLLLGLGWRLPTSTEWTAADGAPQNWGTASDAYSSVLKLHEAGVLLSASGALVNRGTYGYYWSSTQYSSTSYGNFLYIYNGYSAVTYNDKAYGQSVRCIRDTIVMSKPMVSNVSIPDSTITSVSAKGLATVSSDGGALISSRGLCWNTTGNPTIADNTISTGTGIGNISEILINLTEGPTYYVRAYATNSKGTAYSPNVTSFKICPRTFSVIHTAGLNGAPVTKTVTYHSINTNISGAARCWLTQNLGADQQATAVTDATEASAGWYWQFNRSQGYQYTTALTPSNAWTPWITSISENSNWQAANDPCNLLLGLGWRIPTSTEWTNADAPPQNWGTAADAYTSVLKLHQAGELGYSTGVLANRGGYGYYWSSTQYSSTSYGNFLYIYSGYSAVTYNDKAYGQSVRCLRDTLVLSKPSVSDVRIPTATMTTTTATGLATVTSDGGAAITSRGLCWNTTGNPTIADNIVSTGSGIGSISEVLSGLVESPTYYVRAYATNAKGTAYSPTVSSFKICPTSFSVIHTAGLNGAPVSKTVIYHSISSNISGAARCWLTQNLGADSIANAVTDSRERTAGWYWQFNQLQGYQYTTTRTPANAWTPWITSISDNNNWQPANDPCNLLLGLGWRIPTSTEWTNADAPPQNWGTAADGYASELKLHQAGILLSASGALANRGTYGYYWSSTQYSSTSYGNYLYMYSGYSAVTYNDKASGQSVRCIRDTIVLAKPSVSDVTIPTATMTATTAVGSATVSSDGGAPISSRGLCWNTTGNPTIADNKVSTGSGIGSILETLSGLGEGPTYYVRAYATNSAGTAYSPDVSSFKICPTTFTVIHTAGLNGAPVSKNVTYHSISSNISGSAFCWLTQNLGADQQATSVTDATEPSAGWYWQFNRSQGYQYTTALTPSNAWTSWITSISESSNWQAANDPCNLLLGLGWRLPTSVEWTAADAPPQNWGTAADAYASVLKLHQAGELGYSTGVLANRGGYGYYWSSTQYSSTSYGNFLYIYSGYSAVTYNDKAYGQSVRCLRDMIVVAKPSVSDVTIPTATMTATTAVGSAVVTSDGGAAITSRGLCWNTTGNPTIADNTVSTASGIGNIAETLTGLGEGPTYYVRAYATNSQGTAYSPDVSSFKICPTSFTVIHTAGLNGAPVSKNVTYHSISSNVSGAALCWLTQNLGADQQATAVTDATETSAGWYWQFNRSQGYQYTTALTPSNAWTSWITSISENSNWQAANDPCNLLLGLGWRLPTSAEWTNADAPPQNWGTAADAYNSVLKLHQAGILLSASGALANRGTYGYYWSSTQYSSTSYGNYLYMYSGYSAVTYNDKASGQSVRCLRDLITVAKPSVSDVTIPTATMTTSTAVGSAVVASDGGASISARGLCWNTTGTPTIADNTVSTGSGIGNISETLTGLGEGPTYYVRAYATNSQGTSYSPDVSSFKICPTSFTVIHTAGLNGAPVTKTVNYHSISSNISGAAACWLTQNLGADQQATAVTDATEPSAGWYWQFNRSQGYQYTGSRTPAYGWVAWVTGNSENSNWLPANDPCALLLGSGWRIPTSTEWTNADAPPQNWGTAADAYNSVLKLHEAGELGYSTGVLANRGGYGYYWSSTQYSSTSYGNFLYIYSGYSAVTYNDKAYAQSLRCIRDMVVPAKPAVSDVTVPTATMTATSATGTATVTPDGGAPVTDRGLCWNTTGNPTTADNTLPCGTGVGIISATLGGLTQGPTYYVRGYATNSAGTSYSSTVSSFKICPTTFTLTHTAGVNGAPVTKTVNYTSISSNISGAAKCWLTQNLGADQQAASVTDNSEAAAGWYWQFNRSQGYQYTATRTPATAWTTSISENSNWLAANDPCALLLGTGWRIPTSVEWTNADAPPQYWLTAADAYNSELKLHEAGELGYSTGVLANRGGYGYYWSSTQYSSTSYGNFLYIYNGYSAVTYNDKSFGQSVRCIKD